MYECDACYIGQYGDLFCLHCPYTKNTDPHGQEVVDADDSGKGYSRQRLQENDC